MTSLTISVVILGAAIAVSFIYGLFTRNYSTVDRLWSVLPAVYMLIWMPGFLGNPRYIIAFILVLLWCIRLSVNFAVKGGYSFSFTKGFTGEDYRWEVLRGKITNRFLFELFNFFFISGFQLVLIFMFTLPMYYYGSIKGAVVPAEWILYALHLLLLSCELYSDVLQLRFYRRRKAEPWMNQRRYRLGFNTFGIWKYSRHPNYVCEMGQWVVIFFLLVAASGGLHFSGIGALVLVALFAGSTIFAESITASKYKDYKAWRKLSSSWLPLKPVSSRKRREFLS